MTPAGVKKIRKMMHDLAEIKVDLLYLDIEEDIEDLDFTEDAELIDRIIKRLNLRLPEGV